MDYKTDIRKDFRKMIFDFSIFWTDFRKESDIIYMQYKEKTANQRHYSNI